VRAHVGDAERVESGIELREAFAVQVTAFLDIGVVGERGDRRGLASALTLNGWRTRFSRSATVASITP
jgi:hypothetical protein